MTAILFLLLLLMMGLVSALSANAYVNVLTRPGHILSKWAGFLYGLRDSYAARFGPDGSTEHEKAYDKADYLLQPVLTCPYCVAGQLSLWGYFYGAYFHELPYLLAGHIMLIFISIGFVKLFAND